MSKQLEKFEKISTQVSKLNKRVRYYQKLLAEDGTFSAEESHQMKAMEALISKIEASIQTKKSLINTNQKIRNVQAPVQISQATKSIQYSVGKNGKNKPADVLLIQTLLNQKGAKLTVDGQCGPSTIKAIISFQTSLGSFKPDGLINPGKSSWKALIKTTLPPKEDQKKPSKDSKQATANSLKDSVGKGGKNLKKDVELVQSLLSKNGFSILIDGLCGKKTILAIENYQKNLGFWSPDGRIDPKGTTWNALMKGEQGGQQLAEKNSQKKGPHQKPKWISIAEAEIGTKENTSKTKHNPRVMEYHATTGITNNDETPWCSSFVNWVMLKAGQGGTKSAMAISWRKYGKKVSKPAYGAIAVIDWDGPGPGWKGHVGFVVGKQGDKLLILGGNQSNAVNIKRFGTSKIVAYVFPENYTVPENAFILEAGDDEYSSLNRKDTR